MKRLRTIVILPTLFTLANLVCGFFSIVLASRIEAPQSVQPPVSAALERRGVVAVPRFDPADPTHNILFAVCLIFLAMVFDALDGQVARLSRTTSQFGAELDSLADLVTFGIAPALLLVKMCPRFTYLHRETVWVIAACFAACAALRLARFNVESDEADDHSLFSGLPAPAAAASIGGFALMFYTLRRDDTPLQYAAEIDIVLQTFLPLYTLLVALLMVSRIPYPHLVNSLLRGDRSFGQLVGLIFAVAALMVVPYVSVPVLGCLFVLAAPARYFWQEVVQRRPHEEPMF